MHKNNKFSHERRKYIAESIENLKNDDHYLAIFEILLEDSHNSYTQNSNGVFLNIANISDKTVARIVRYLDKISNTSVNIDSPDIDQLSRQMTLRTDRTYKLSNYEKNIIKQQNIKKILNSNREPLH